MTLDRRFSVAPMMEWTDRWCRRFHRVLTRRALLFTEMATSAAVTRGDVDRLIGFDPREAPAALQLGGSDPSELARAAKIGAGLGYGEINLNVGCPSDRVQSGAFGACLMRQPDIVAAGVAAMKDAVDVPVTVKCRIGVDDQEPGEALFGFVAAVAAAGCSTFYVHARKAWLKGLSPKENRDVPPLDYAVVRALKRQRPDLEILLNGGLRSLAQAETEAAGLDGVMFGRAAYQTPWTLADVDARVFGQPPSQGTRAEAALALAEIVDEARAAGFSAHAVTRHALGLFHGQPGARAWRRHLSENAVKPGAGPDVVLDALALVEDAADARAAA